MFDNEKFEALPAKVEKLWDVAKMALPDLLRLREEVNAALPATKLVDLNLEEEVVIQYLHAKALMAEVAEDKDTPANQKAQVANSCQAILDQLTKRQLELYGTERVKAIEQCLIRVLKRLTEEQQRDFFADYEQTYRAALDAKEKKSK